MNSYSEILFLFEISAVSIFAVILFACIRKKVAMLALLDNVMDSSEVGTVTFDRRGKFKKANSYARSAILPIIDDGLGKLNADDFIERLSEYSSNIDEKSKSTILKGVEGGTFKDVVSLGDDSLFLVEKKEIKGGVKLFILTNVVTSQALEDDLVQLNDFNNQLIQAIQATTSGVVISDPKSEANPILFANDAFCEYVSCKRENLIGGDWGVVLSMIHGQDDKKKFMRAIDEVKELDVAIESLADDDIRYFTMKLTPVEGEDGEVDLFIGVMSEITLLRKRESEFFHVQKLESLGQLSAGVAHDFNNILSIISGYSLMSANSIGCMGCAKSVDIKGYLERIDKASERGAALTRKMLTFSRNKVVSQSIINVVDIVNEQHTLLLPLLGVSIDLEVNIADEEVNIKGLADSVEQILMNFVVNGRDAMTDGGTITIDVRRVNVEEVPKKVHEAIGADNYACISVSDMGFGMDEKTVEKIFDPFFSTKDQGKGTGLGLSVVYGLVKEMGGALDVASILGAGTVMSFYAPLSNEERSKKITGSVADLSTVSLEGYTALVAEDEPDLLLLVSSMLERLGMRVLAASNGDEALVLLDDNLDGVDILLTDVVMPELNGVKLAELVNALSPNIKTIFMSGYPANGDMAPVGMPDGATFVAKPVDYKNLAALILQEVKDSASSSVGVDVGNIPQWEVSSSVREGSSNV